MIIEVDSRSCEEAIEESENSSSPQCQFLGRRKHVLSSIKELVEQRIQTSKEMLNSRIATEYQLTGRERPYSPPHGTQSRNMKALSSSALSENKSRSGLTGGDAANQTDISKWQGLIYFTILITARMPQRSMNTMRRRAWSVPLQPQEVRCLPAVLNCCYPKIRPYSAKNSQISSLLLVPLDQPSQTMLLSQVLKVVVRAESGSARQEQPDLGCRWNALSGLAKPLPLSLKYVSLICDPVAGLVEVRVKRNAMGGLAFAFIALIWPWQVSSLRSC